jgi:hypothetical protein
MNNAIFNEFNFIILEIIIGSLTAFIAVYAFSKTKKIFGLFFIIAALFFYMLLIFDALKELQIFSISAVTINNISVIKYIITYLSFIFLSAGFIFLIRDK